MPVEVSTYHAASLFLLILHSCQFNLSDEAAVSSLAFQSLSASHWPLYIWSQPAFPSSSVEREAFTPCSLLSEHCLHFSPTVSLLRLITQPDMLSVALCLLDSVHPSKPALHALITMFTFFHPICSFMHLSYFLLNTLPTFWNAKINKDQTNLKSCIFPTEPTIAFHSAWNQECTGCKYWIYSLGVQTLLSKHLICVYRVPDPEFGNKI